MLLIWVSVLAMEQILDFDSALSLKAFGCSQILAVLAKHLDQSCDPQKQQTAAAVEVASNREVVILMDSACWGERIVHTTQGLCFCNHVHPPRRSD
jgi:hypothetical protein